MTDEMMSLRTLLEKSADADLLREMIGFAAHRLMELEVETLTGPVMTTRDVYGGLPEAAYREPNYAGRIISAPAPGPWSHGWRRAGVKGCARQAGRASGAPR